MLLQYCDTDIVLLSCSVCIWWFFLCSLFVCLFWVFSVSPTDHNIQEMVSYAYTLRQMHAYALLKPYSLSAFMYVHIYLTQNIHMYKTGMKTHTNIIL